MAVARQIEIHKGKDGVVAVRRDVIVDPELGIAAEVEKVVAAVDVGGGKVALLEATQVKGVKAIPNRVTTEVSAEQNSMLIILLLSLACRRNSDQLLPTNQRRRPSRTQPPHDRQLRPLPAPVALDPSLLHQHRPALELRGVAVPAWATACAGPPPRAA